MKKLIRTTLCLATLFVMGFQADSEARVGTFNTGYGCKAKGMGGVAVALPQDSLVGAINPAGCVWLDNRFDGAVELLIAPRTYTHSNALALGRIQLQPHAEKLRGYPQFLIIPEGGINYMLNDYSAVGAALYSGGGDTIYKRTNPIAAGAVPSLYQKKNGLSLVQNFLALSYSRMVLENQSIGLALVWCTQTLNIRGLHGFDNATGSVAPGSVTNRNIDWSSGAGFRIGWFGQLSPTVSAGASYTTRMAMTRFRRYKGVVTQKGRLEIPAILAAGVTWDWDTDSTLSFEWQRLFYKECKLWGNSFKNYLGAGGTQKSGAENGPGFGWSNMDVFKVGADYDWDYWTFRGGYLHSTVPYGSNQLDVNVLTQNMGGHHLTLGTTFRLSESEDIDFSYFHMFRVRVSGQSQLVNNLGTLTQRMYQDSFEIAYGRSF